MAQKSKSIVERHKMSKVEMTKAELREKTEEEKKLIYKYEK